MRSRSDGNSDLSSSDLEDSAITIRKTSLSGIQADGDRWWPNPILRGWLVRTTSVPFPLTPALSPRAKPCPHLFVLMYHYLIVPQPLMYFIGGCLNPMRPPFVLHRLNRPTGPATNSLAPNCPINVSTSVCA